ncbi:alpha/beta hydrolase [Acinetobacter larvae]|uniref:Alpha/beta hydrolase n=2 Tax=Acinetobacter larvae TaxID=1789224 RepID=A0A1B2M1K9_9GAMM|nr:alpha/beta hydrolase [Acinetobacter larvae]
MLSKHILPLLNNSLLTLAVLLSGNQLFIQTSHAQTPSVAVERYHNILNEQRRWAGLENKTLHVGDVVWTYSEGGDPAKPTLLLIHGLASSRDTWNEVAHALTPYYHVIIPDLPTSAETQTPAHFDFSVPNVTEHLRRFIEAAHIQDNLNIAGHSLGGVIAMFYAAQYPDDIQSLMLVSSGGIYQNNHSPYIKNPMAIKELVVSKPGDMRYMIKKVMYDPPFMPTVLFQQKEKMLISQSDMNNKVIQQLIELNKLYTNSSFAKMVREINAPTLIIWGKQDQIITVEAAQELQQMLHKPEPPVLLERVGHVPIVEAPERVIEQYLVFLQKNTTP